MGLEWVQREIEQTLLQCDKSLQIFIEQNDVTAMRQCVTCVHQVQGTLQMIGFSVLADFAAVIEQVAQGFLSKNIEFSNVSLAVLLRAIRHLSIFLPQAQQTDEAMQKAIDPVLRELKKITALPDESNLPDALPGLLKKIHQLFHFALLNVFRQEKLGESIAFLGKALTRLENLSATVSPMLVALCQLSARWIDSLDAKLLAEGDRLLLTQLDELIKSFFHQASLTSNQLLVDEMFAKLLERMSDHPLMATDIAEIKQRYQLGRDQLSVSSTNTGIMPIDKAVMANAAQVIGGALQVLKASIESFLETEQQKHSALQPCGLACLELVEVLSALHQPELQNKVQNLQTIIEQTVSDGSCLTAEQLDGFADDILKIQGVLQHLTQASPLSMTVRIDMFDQVLQSARSEAFNACRVELQLIKETIVMVVNGQAQVSTLALVPEQFLRIIGALLIMDLSVCAQLVRECLDYVDQQLVRSDNQLPAQWEALADVIAGIDYYLECAPLNQEAGNKILEVVRQKLLAIKLLEVSVVEKNTAEELTTEELTTEEPTTEEPTVEIASAFSEINMIDDEVIDIFVEEVGEILETLDTYFLRWQESHIDAVAMKEMRRGFHSLKGSGRMVGAVTLGEVAWCAENLMNRLIDRTIRVTPEIIRTVHWVVQSIPPLLNDFQHRQSPSVDIHKLQAQLRHLSVEPLLTSTQQTETDRSDAAQMADTVQQSAPKSVRSEASSVAHMIQNEGTTKNINFVDDAKHSQVDGYDAIPEYALEKPSQPDQMLLKIFGEEALSHLYVIESYLTNIEEFGENSESLLRALHTLKGSASMANVVGVTSLVAPTERLIKGLDMLRLPLPWAVQLYLSDFSTNIRNVLPQLLHTPNSEVADHASLITRLLGFYKQYFSVDSLEFDLDQLHFEVPRTSLHAQLLPQDIDLLQNSESLLLQLQNNPFEHLLASQSMRRALKNVAEKALADQQPQIAGLCNLLEQCHGRLQQQAVVDAGIFHWLQEGHISLLDLLDALAAGQSLILPDDVMLHLKVFASRQNDVIAMLVSGQRVGTDLQDELAVAESIASNQSIDAQPLQAANNFTEGELFEIFIEEASDIIVGLGSLLNDWLIDHNNLLKVEELQRELHTLKGGARISGLMEFAQFSEHLEIFYEAICDDRVFFSTELSMLLQDCQHQLSIMLKQLLNKLPTPIPQNLLQKISYFMSGAYNKALQNSHDADPVDVEQPNYQETKPVLFLSSGEGSLVKLEVEPLLEEKVPAAVFPQVELAVNSSRAALEEPSAIPVDFSADLAWLFAPGFDKDIFDIFHEEVNELLESLDQSLHEWSNEPSNTKHLQEMQRVLHTLKGSARLAGLSQLGDLAHDFESFLDQQAAHDAHFFRQAQQRYNAVEQALITLKLAYELGPEAYAQQLASAVLPATEVKSVHEPAVVLQEPNQEPNVVLSHIPDSEEETVIESNSVFSTAILPATKGLIVNSPSSSPDQVNKGSVASNESQFKEVPFAPPVKGRKLAYITRHNDRAEQEMVKVQGVLLEKLVNLAGETTISSGRIETQVRSFAFTLNDLTSTIARVTDLLRRLDLQTEAHMAYRFESQLSGDEEFDPLEMDRYSMLHQLSRSLAESASDIADLKDTLSNNIRDTESLLMQQSRINTQLQEGLMRAQLVPFGRMLPRLRRMVRQLSDELQKQVNLEVVNADSEMDRKVLDRMVAPLEHMLRNSVDHGIEMPAERLAAGKSVEGRITLLLAREGGEVVLRLSDDGRGMQLESIKRQAIARGLMKADAALSENDILQFVFKPGFSTAEKVTQISGRGVGMDVVYSEIKQLGGSMKIHSALGVGTQFTIRLPFTVAITRALMVRVGDDAYAIPLNNIEGVVRISPNELMTFYRAHNAPKFTYAGLQYRVQYLGSFVQGITVPPLHGLEHGLEKPVPILLVRSGDSSVALQVDALIGSREVVVKSLGPQLSSVSGISGATILGDGSVVIILDVVALLRAERAGQGALAQASTILPDTNKRLRSTPLVMVVDDSVTVRKVTSRLLERHGLDVVVAKDGVDAMTKLQDVLPDLILLDIEMPRMDGFEVASQVRHNDRLQMVPIIMITSRTGEKHRSRAFSLGVNDFMGKPYQETHLVEAMQAILGKDAVKT